MEDWWLTDRVTGRALVFGELLVLSDQPRVPTCRLVSVRIVKPTRPDDKYLPTVCKVSSDGGPYTR